MVVLSYTKAKPVPMGRALLWPCGAGALARDSQQSVIAPSYCYFIVSFQCFARHSATDEANADAASMFWLCFRHV